MTRGRGPLCTAELSPGWIDPGTMARTQTSAPTPAGSNTPTPEEAELLLDLGQMVLDLVGILDPTPLSDGTNALISVGRRDWFGAAISAVSIVPFLGDLAKAGKLGRWASCIERTVALARKNARFAERARPVMKKIADLLGRLPGAVVPASVRPALERIQRQLDNWLGLLPRLSRRTLLRQAKQDWLDAIARMKLPTQPSGKGVLWSKLDGYKHAELLARQDGKVTLEMVLEPTRFAEAYEIAVAELKQELGHTKAVGETIWSDFGRPVWEAVSRKYSETLNGRVTAYVRFESTAVTKEGRLLDKDKVLDMVDKVTDAQGPPIITDELLAIADSMSHNPRITSVELVDVFTGKTRIMDRASVLRGGRFDH